MTARLAILLCLLFMSCRRPTHLDLAPSGDTRQAFFTSGAQYAPKIANDAALPAPVTIAEVLSHSSDYAERRVTISGCYAINPYHGAFLRDQLPSVGSLALFGGSDDLGAQPFDWMRQKVCGTFVGTIKFKTREEPLKCLCPEVCFLSEGTVDSEIVSNDDAPQPPTADPTPVKADTQP